MQKTTPRRSTIKTRQPETTKTYTIHPESGPYSQIQLKARVSNLWVGHSARDCYHRNTTTSAYRSVPYTKQSTEENKQFRRDFRQTNNRICNTNELSHTANDEINDTEKIGRHDDLEDSKTSIATSSTSTKQKCAPK